MRILAANDDGVRAEGFIALINELKKIGEVTAIAPETERSAAGHSVTFFAPLRLKRLSEEENLTIYSCSGTPTDCVLMGIAEVMKDNPPDIIITGINYGPNLGDDATYSGTISSAMEGVMAGIPSIAVSTGIHKTEVTEYALPAKVAAQICKLVHKNKLPPRILLSVNVPAVSKDEIKGIKISHLGQSNFKYGFIKRSDAGHRDYYWLTREPDIEKASYPDSDYEALHNNYISITPVHLNLTCKETSELIKKWDLGNIWTA